MFVGGGGGVAYSCQKLISSDKELRVDIRHTTQILDFQICLYAGFLLRFFS